MSMHGEYRQDGSWIGFDYDRQVWIDTSPVTARDTTKTPGSASNPLDYVPCALCAAHYSDDGRCDERKPVASPHRAALRVST